MLGLITAATLTAATPAASADCLLRVIGFDCDEPAPPPTAAPDPGGAEAPDQPVPAAGKRFGFNLGYQPPGDASPEQSLAAMEATGASLLRYVVAWRGFSHSAPYDVVTDEMETPPEQLPPRSGLRQLDEQYANLIARGITPVISLGDVPPWASLQHRCLDLVYAALRPSQCPPGWWNRRLFPAPQFYPQWREFVGWAAARWPHALLEGPNEPDRDAGDATAPRPAAAAAIQCELYAAAKSVDTRPVLSMAVTEPSYVTRYVTDAHRCYDLYSFHPYTRGYEFGAKTELARLFDGLRSARAAAGDSSPIWVTETGFTAITRAGSQEEAEWERIHVDASRRLYNRLITMEDVGAVLFHTLRDRPTDRDRSDPEYHFGFFYEDWRPKLRACHFVAQAGGAWPGC